MPRTTMISLAAAAATTAVLGLAACGEDQERAGAANPRAAGDAARYCALAKELDAAGTEFFAKLEADESAGQEDFEKAERDFVARYAPRFAEIETVAPAEVRAEVRTVLTAQRERAGLADTRTSEDSIANAEKTVKAFEARHCAS